MGADEQPIRVLIADDQEIVRKALRLLREVEGFAVVGEAANGIEAAVLCKQLRPDVVLIDVNMPKRDGIEAIHRIRSDCPKTQVITLTSVAAMDMVTPALQAGAIGFLLKNVSIEELVKVIRAAATGQATLSNEVVASLISDKHVPHYHLTKREVEILRLMIQGLNNREIGEQLYITISTVKSHITSIFGKFDVKRRSQAIALAVQHHLVDYPRE